MFTYMKTHSRSLSRIWFFSAPLFAGLLALVTSSCGPATESAQAEGAQTVPVACGSCIYGMEGVEGCETAVKIDGKSYLVTGENIDAHNVGLCSSEKKALVTGQVEGDKFVATSIKLVN